jgi:hypothetical protein|tara:strand:+ start:226 stop:450 length:225 start_codon:yes stop_codon:yes gene_type:complete
MDFNDDNFNPLRFFLLKYWSLTVLKLAQTVPVNNEEKGTETKQRMLYTNNELVQKFVESDKRFLNTTTPSPTAM